MKTILLTSATITYLLSGSFANVCANSWNSVHPAFIPSEAPPISAPVSTQVPIRRYRHVTFSPALRAAMQGKMDPGFSVSMNLFPHLEVPCELISHRLTSKNVHLTRWLSKDNPDTMILFAMHNDKVAGSLKLNEEGNFHVELAGGDTYRIVEQNPLTSPKCGVGNHEPKHTQPLAAPAQGKRSSSALMPRSSSRERPIEQIDLLMVYTTEAKHGGGGEDAIRATCALYVEETNWIFELSDIPTHINIIHFAESTEEESGSVSDEWQRLAGNRGSLYEELRTMRKDYGADLISMIIERTNDHLGEGALPRNQNQGFNQAHNINVRAGLHWDYLLAHELGHNFGCGHDRDNAGTGTYTFPYSYGHRFIAEDIKYATVMAYTPGQWIHHFSNPDVLYKGTPTGVPENQPLPANNAENIRSWSQVISRYHDRDYTLTFDQPVYEVLESIDTLKVQIKRSGLLEHALTGFLSAIPDTAEGEMDYAFGRQRVVLEVGEASKEIEIKIIDDVLTEGTEQLKLVFSGLNTRGREKIVAGEHSEAIIQIIDDDPGLGFSLEEWVVEESDQEVVLLLNRFGSSETSYTVDYEIVPETAQPGLDFEGNQRQLTMKAGEESIELRIPIQDDELAEKDETFLVRFVASSEETFTAEVNQARVTIKDNDREGLLTKDTYAEGAPNNSIWTITETKSGDLLVGGMFNKIGDETIPLIARYYASGTLDQSFQCPDLKGVVVHDIMEQPDGKILVGGEIWLEDPVQYGLVRLLQDGTPDPTFRQSSGFDGPVKKIQMQSDGSLIIYGEFYHFNGHPINYLARLTSEGKLDTTFHNKFTVKDFFTGMGVLPDDRILIGGLEEMAGERIIKNLQRLNADGTIDSSWTRESLANEAVHSFWTSHDGSIYITGEFTRIGRHGTTYLAKLHPDGTPDTSFSTGLIRAGDGPNGVWQLRLAIQPDGKLIVAGGFTQWGNHQRSRIARLHPDGSLDTSFDVGIGPSGMTMDMVQLLDGEIVIAGEFTEVGGHPAPYLAKLHSDGTQPYLTQLKPIGDQLNMTILGNAPRTFELQQSNNFTDWETVQSVESKDASTELTINKPKTSEPAFYRVLQKK